MKSVLRKILIGILMIACLGLFAGAQSEKPENLSSDDLLIKAVVETAVSALQVCYALYREGVMSFEEAKKLGADLLRELRYGSEGYFWADTTEGVNVVLYGRKDVEGRNRLEDKDPNGTYYVKEFLTKGKAGGGYVEYWFTKEGQTVNQPKRSYVLLFEPFGWVVGSGYYR